jgi:hypothetical protein
MSKYTPAQLRRAFYQAAADIEARPDLYDFYSKEVGEGGCPACMWGHVGRALKMSAENSNSYVAFAAGFPDPEFYGWDFGNTGVLYSFQGVANVDPNDAANKLRAFADHHWPDCDMPDWNAMAYAEEAAA